MTNRAVPRSGAAAVGPAGSAAEHDHLHRRALAGTRAAGDAARADAVAALMRHLQGTMRARCSRAPESSRHTEDGREHEKPAEQRPCPRQANAQAATIPPTCASRRCAATDRLRRRRRLVDGRRRRRHRAPPYGRPRASRRRPASRPTAAGSPSSAATSSIPRSTSCPPRAARRGASPGSAPTRCARLDARRRDRLRDDARPAVLPQPPGVRASRRGRPAARARPRPGQPYRFGAGRRRRDRPQHRRPGALEALPRRPAGAICGRRRRQRHVPRA